MMTRRLLALLLALLLGAGGALAEEESIELRFEDGFSLSLPAGWVSYPAGDGARYALGDGEGHCLYILARPVDYADFDALQADVSRRADCEATGALDLNGQTFAAFIAADLNASGCATLLDGRAFIFLFTPQDDAEYMQVVARIMASFRLA